MGQVIVIIGASQDRGRYSNKAVRAWTNRGWTVVPVHPKHDEVEGLKAFPSVDQVPGAVDVASFYVPPEVGIKVLDAVAKKGIKEVYLNPGAESDELVAKAQSLGLETHVACSILAIGESPGEY
jgi:predicted CoA-binding protein